MYDYATRIGDPMADDPTRRAFVQAAEIARVVPKHLQEAAFNRALDHLLGRTAPATGARAFEPRRGERAERRGNQDEFSGVFDSISRTKHPDVGSTTRVADRALKVLELAQQTYSVDGLTAAQIADILTKKFRLPVKVNAVNMALERETDCVDVTRNTAGVKRFHLMAPGEEYLQRLRSGEKSARQRKPAKAIRKDSNRDNAQAEDPKIAKKAEVKPSKKSSTSRPGPKAAIGKLLASSFFKSARIITQVQEELRNNWGHQYSVQELAPALVRSLREGTLKRDRNASGQYEYTER